MRNINFYQGLFLIVFALIFVKCNDPSTIGLEVQPEEDKINILYIDTTTIVSYTVKEDSIPSSQTSLNLLGNYTDPVFGQVKADFVTQLHLPANNVTFPTDAVLDSIVLALAYNGYYGDTNNTYDIAVYKVTEDIDLEQDSLNLGYSNHAYQYDPTAIGNLSLIPRPTDSTLVGSNTMQPHLRIPLSNTFGNELLMLDSMYYVDDETFSNYLKGLYVTVTNNNTGSILYFNLLSQLSMMALYYHTTEDTAVFEFDVDNHVNRVGHFEHNYTGTEIQTVFDDITNNDSINYLQAMSGTKVKIYFPHIDEWANAGNIIINRAELVIPVSTLYDNSLYTPPSKLIIAAINDDGETIFIIDQFQGSDYFGGEYNEDEQKYVFNIAKHVQKLINGEIQDNGLYLMISGSAVNATRVVINGGKKTDNPLKLNITYSKL